MAELAGLVDGGAKRLIRVGGDAAGSADADAVRPRLDLLHVADRGLGASSQKGCGASRAGEHEQPSHIVRHGAANRNSIASKPSTPCLYATSWRRPEETVADAGRRHKAAKKMVGATGIKRLTPAMSTQCSYRCATRPFRSGRLLDRVKALECNPRLSIA